MGQQGSCKDRTQCLLFLSNLELQSTDTPATNQLHISACFIFLLSSTNSKTPPVSIQHVIYLTSERYGHSSYKHSENYLNDYGKPITFMFLIFHVSGVRFMSVRPDQVTNDRITQSLQPPLTISVPHLALCSSAAEAVTDKSTVDNC